ncbi:hypothetical protein HMPREF1602_04099 [Escherichia coli 907889]|nr:hypothetical protein HMPREF1602_04099 [Escherichia coli 907889]
MYHSIYTRHTSSCMYCDSNYLEYINIKIRKWQTNPGQEKRINPGKVCKESLIKDLS